MAKAKAASKPQANLITNGDFSNGGTGWVPTNNVSFAEQRCDIAANGQNEFASQGPIRVTAGTAYTVKYRGYASVNRSGASLALITNAGTTLYLELDEIGEHEYLRNFVMPAGATQVECRLNGASTAVWYDDIVFEEGAVSDELIRNGDFSEAGAYWTVKGVSFDEDECAIGQVAVSQTVAAPTGIYQLKLRTLAVGTSVGRFEIKHLPGGGTQGEPFSNTAWEEKSIYIQVEGNTTSLEVSLIREIGTGVRFDDVSLKRT